MAIAAALLLCLGLIVYAKTARVRKGPYSLAEDFPRGALVYAQFSNLPALVKQWDASSLKQQYLASANFRQLQNRHLALKLAARWQEFNDALGFPLDSSIITNAADSGAAFAIYDIGRLDIVFIAPLNEERAAATKFFQSSGQFEETELPDGTAYYRQEVEADRGRQKQQLVFASLKGRFVLATNEQLFLRALSNISAKARGDRLADEPMFKSLSAEVAPHFATVWLDQMKLNEDWYFKHYWLMRNLDELKTIRACMFDLEIEDGRWIERRDFITAGREASRRSAIQAYDAAHLAAMIPDSAPFFKLQSVSQDTERAAAMISSALFDRLQTEDEEEAGRHRNSGYYDDYDLSSSYSEQYMIEEHYSYLDEDFDSTIDDAHDAGLSKTERPGANPLTREAETEFALRLRQAVEPARPLAAAMVASPQTISGPLFVEFRRMAILTLQNPAALNREALETAIVDAALSRVSVAGKSAYLKWVSHDEGTQSWRSLDLPMLGWHLCYALHDRDLIFSNSNELLTSALARHGAHQDSSRAAIDEMAVIRLDQRRQAFDEVLGRLDREEAERRARANNSQENSVSTSDTFFAGNIGSLLDVASNLSRIEIRRHSSANRLHEEIEFILR